MKVGAILLQIFCSCSMFQNPMEMLATQAIATQLIGLFVYNISASSLVAHLLRKLRTKIEQSGELGIHVFRVLAFWVHLQIFKTPACASQSFQSYKPLPALLPKLPMAMLIPSKTWFPNFSLTGPAEKAATFSPPPCPTKDDHSWGQTTPVQK